MDAKILAAAGFVKVSNASDFWSHPWGLSVREDGSEALMGSDLIEDKVPQTAEDLERLLAYLRPFSE